MKKQLLAGLIAANFSAPAFAVEVSEQLEVFGTIEAEYGNVRTEVDDGAGNISTNKEIGTAASTLAFGAKVKPNDKFDITASWLYEEGLHSVDTPTEIDEASVTWHARPEEKLDISVGKRYLPFGKFDTSMVSDPATLALGETRMDKVLQASGKNGNFSGTVYVFDGKSTKTGTTNRHSGGIGFGAEYATEKHSIGVGYISNLTESGAFGDVNNAGRKVPGVTLYGSAKLGKVTLVGEHLMATQAFQAGDLAGADEDGNGVPDSALTTAAKPSSTHLEAAVDLNNDRTVAIAWDKTKDANEQLGLSKKSYGIAYRQPLYKDLVGAIELRESKDYANLKTKALTAQVAYEF